jgi:phosphatidylinositol alpha-1,6-mannosyltransferase
VQRAGRHVAAVFSKYAGAHGITCRLLSLNDPQGLHTIRVGSAEFQATGHARNKLQFALTALHNADRRSSLVFALHPNLLPIAAVMKLRYRKLRSLVFTHGIEVWQALNWPRGPALRSANFVVAPSADTVQRLLSEQGVNPRKIRKLAWGLDPEFEIRLDTPSTTSRPPGFPQGGQIVLTVGRWDPAERYKGADTLISVLPLVLKSFPDTRLVLVGDGEDRKRLEHLAGELNVSDHTYFLHGLTQEALFACYAHCDVFALPSRGEGFGLVFLEAMALGKPVIGGAHGGTPDVIEDEVTGLLVPHGEVEPLRTAIESLLADPARANQMGANGKARVKSLYMFEQFERRLTQIIEESLIGQPRKWVSPTDP